MPRCYIVKKQTAVPAFGRFPTTNGPHQVTFIGAGTGGSTGVGATTTTTVGTPTEVGNVIVNHNGTMATLGASPGVICSPVVGQGATPGTGNVIILNSVSVISGGPAGGGGVTLGSPGGGQMGGVIHHIEDTSSSSAGPTSPTEACVAPIYYTNIAENQNGKFDILAGFGMSYMYIRVPNRKNG